MQARILAPSLVLAVGSGLALVGPQTSGAPSSEPAKETTGVNRCWPHDNGRPVLDELTVSPSTVDVTDAPATITVTLKAHDTGGPGKPTGIEAALVLLQNLTDHVGVDPGLHRVDGTTWRGTAVVRRGTAATQLTSEVFLSDRTRDSKLSRLPNSTDTGPSQQPALTIVDSAPTPAASARLARPRTAPTTPATERAAGARSADAGIRVLHHPRVTDIRKHGRWVSVRIRISEPRGVRRVTLQTDLRGSVGVLHRVSGTRANGVWQGRAREPFCAWSDGRHWGVDRLVVRASDGTRRTVSIPLGRLRGRDHEPPQSRLLHRPDGAGDPASVWVWSEPVHGITNAHTPVTDGGRLAGCWRCRNRAGKRTSCRTGSVIRATFWQTQEPYLQLTTAIWEPNHRLDVLDSAGNPSFNKTSASQD